MLADVKFTCACLDWMIGWIFRGRSFRTRLLLLFVLVCLGIYYSENILEQLKEHLADESPKERNSRLHDELDHELHDLLKMVRTHVEFSTIVLQILIFNRDLFKFGPIQKFFSWNPWLSSRSNLNQIWKN